MRKENTNKKFKKGAASFYIVAISTLILVIVAASFAAVIVSEVTRTSNDDLAQSAYDAALAGVEDAKLAYYNYQTCKRDGTAGVHMGISGSMSCSQLVVAVEDGSEDCDMVAKTLGRQVALEDGGFSDLTSDWDADRRIGVPVQETNSADNPMKQYYTCVKVSTTTDDYLGELDSQDPEHAVRVKFDGDSANELDYIQLSWHSVDRNADAGSAGNRLHYEAPNPTAKVVPAALAVTVLQTGGTFNLSDFDRTKGGQTDRGTVYLIPTDGSQSAGAAEGNLSSPVDYGARITDDPLAKSNDKGEAGRNFPYQVECKDGDGDDGYACSVGIPVPDPIGGDRSNDTFVVSVALLYGEPKTDYRLEFFSGGGSGVSQQMKLDGVQIRIDSTGRANDLFRRVDTRLEPSDAEYPYPIYGIEAWGNGGDPAILKDFDTTCEYNFADQTCA